MFDQEVNPRKKGERGDREKKREEKERRGVREREKGNRDGKNERTRGKEIDKRRGMVRYVCVCGGGGGQKLKIQGRG